MLQRDEIHYMELTKEMADARVVADINRLLPQLSSSASPVTEELHYMFDSGTRLFVAIDDARIIGTVLLCPMVILVGQKDWIEDVIVDEEYRRMGIAGHLMDMAEEVSQVRSAKSINLTSKPERDGACTARVATSSGTRASSARRSNPTPPCRRDRFTVQGEPRRQRGFHFLEVFLYRHSNG